MEPESFVDAGFKVRKGFDDIGGCDGCFIVCGVRGIGGRGGGCAYDDWPKGFVKFGL